MGSFNETCGVSGLPIPWKTPCRIFIIRPHSYLPLHYQSIWEPLILGSFPGVYEDCGGLESLEDGPAIRIQHQVLHKLVREFSEEARERHSETLKRYPDDPSAVLELCERGVLNVFTPHGECVAAPFYVREDVYRHVIDLCTGLSDFRDRPIVDTTREMVRLRFEHQDDVRRCVQEGDPGAALSVELDMRRDEYENHETRYLASDLLRATDLADPEVREDVATAMTEFELFSIGMDMVHVRWAPKTHRGQEADYDFHAKWHRAVADMADEAKRRWEEDEW
jgi:hypothetical protein